MANYHSTSEVLDAVQGQIEKTLKKDTDAVFQFFGSLGQAVVQHLGQGGGGGIRSVVAIGLDEGVAQSSVAGSPLMLNEAAVLYVIVRMKRETYREDVQHLLQIVDQLTYEAFSCDNTADDFKDVVASANFLSRRPVITEEQNIFSYRIDWNLRPKRKAT